MKMLTIPKPRKASTVQKRLKALENLFGLMSKRRADAFLRHVKKLRAEGRL